MRSKNQPNPIEHYERSIAVYKRAHGQRRPPLIPQNYAGNAFPSLEKQEMPSKEECEISASDTPQMCCECEHHCESEGCECCECECECECYNDISKGSLGKDCPKESPCKDKFGLFRGGIGSEELLLLSLIFITAQSGQDDGILLYLILLLFL